MFEKKRDAHVKMANSLIEKSLHKTSSREKKYEDLLTPVTDKTLRDPLPKTTSARSAKEAFGAFRDTEEESGE